MSSITPIRLTDLERVTFAAIPKVRYLVVAPDQIAFDARKVQIFAADRNFQCLTPAEAFQVTQDASAADFAAFVIRSTKQVRAANSITSEMKRHKAFLGYKIVELLPNEVKTFFEELALVLQSTETEEPAEKELPPITSQAPAKREAARFLAHHLPLLKDTSVLYSVLLRYLQEAKMDLVSSFWEKVEEAQREEAIRARCASIEWNLKNWMVGRNFVTHFVENSRGQRYDVSVAGAAPDSRFP